MRVPPFPDYDPAMHGRSGGGGAAVRATSGTGVALQRAAGVGRIRVTATGVAELYQEGALRLRLLRGRVGDASEIVAINTAGGLTGGDRLDLTVAAAEGAAVTLTTPACEKIYRSAGGEASVANTITAGANARVDWLPQPMILFDGARTRRSLVADVAGDASLLAVEGVILGRTAMAEDIRSGALRDSWRIRRDGILVFADAFRAEGDIRTALAGTATLAGARALATVVYVAQDAERRLDSARAALEFASGEAGASAWNGILVVRFLATDGQMLIADLGAFLAAFRGAPLPRSWLC